MELCQYPNPNKTRYFKIEAIQLPYGLLDADAEDFAGNFLKRFSLFRVVFQIVLHLVIMVGIC